MLVAGLHSQRIFYHVNFIKVKKTLTINVFRQLFPTLLEKLNPCFYLSCIFTDVFICLSSPPFPVHILTSLPTLHYSQYPFAQDFLTYLACTQDQIHISWHLECSTVWPLSASLIFNASRCLHRSLFPAIFVC